MNPLSGYAAAVAALGVCIAATLSQAQDLGSTTVVDGNRADMTFGPSALARPYTTREAAKWGFDFIASPSRATDRHLFFGYKIADLQPELIQEILERCSRSAAANERKSAPLVAFVNVPTSGPLPVLGGDRAYYAAPFFAPGSDANSTEVRRQFSQNANDLAPRLVALAALRSTGISVAGLNDELLRPKNVASYIAVNKEIPNRKPDRYFIMAESAWMRSGAEAPLVWGVTFSK